MVKPALISPTSEVVFFRNLLFLSLPDSSIKEEGIIKNNIVKRGYSSTIKVGESGDDKKNPLNSKINYTKVVVEDPYNNREIIAKIAKNQKGVYV
jgi:hypothetical protein